MPFKIIRQGARENISTAYRSRHLVEARGSKRRKQSSSAAEVGDAANAVRRVKLLHRHDDHKLDDKPRQARAPGRCVRGGLGPAASVHVFAACTCERTGCAQPRRVRETTAQEMRAPRSTGRDARGWHAMHADPTQAYRKETKEEKIRTKETTTHRNACSTWVRPVHTR